MLTYAGYLENRQWAEVVAAQTVARASLAGNDLIDVEKAIESVERQIQQIRNTMPYLTKGMSAEDDLDRQRKAAVKQYHQYLKNTLGEKRYHEYLKEKLGEEGYDRFMRNQEDA